MDRYLLSTILVNAVWLKSNLLLAHKIKKLVENGVNEVTFGYTTKTRDIIYIEVLSYIMMVYVYDNTKSVLLTLYTSTYQKILFS